MNIVKELCIRSGLQQKQLAIMVGVSQPTVSDWINQKKDPSGERLEKLSEIFGVSRAMILGYDDLIDRTSEPSTQPDELTSVAQSYARLDDAGKRLVSEMIERLLKSK